MPDAPSDTARPARRGVVSSPQTRPRWSAPRRDGQEAARRSPSRALEAAGVERHAADACDDWSLIHHSSGSNEQMFGAKQQVPHGGSGDKKISDRQRGAFLWRCQLAESPLRGLGAGGLSGPLVERLERK